MAALLEGVFRIEERGSSVKAELLGGLTMFMGSAFNLVATASVLEAGGLPSDEGVAGGAWAGFFGNMLVGLLSNLPICVVAGAGPNFTVAYLLARGVGSGGLGDYRAAMTCCMVAGGIIALLTLLGGVNLVTNLVPKSLKLGICVGIGLLCAFVGMQQINMVVRSEEGLVGLGDKRNPEIWFTFCGLMLLASLNAHRVRGAILGTMLLVTAADWAAWQGWPALEVAPYRLPALQAPDWGALGGGGLWAQQAAMVMMLVFDAMGCVFGMARLAGRLDPATGRVDGGDGLFYGIGIGTALSAWCGCSPLVVSGASAAAIVEGAQTGLSSCCCGCLFLLAGLPLAKICTAVPPCATSVVLIYVGLSMSSDAKEIAWEDPISALPAFLCIICQPFLFSIADGIYVGIASSLALWVLSGRMLTDLRAKKSGGGDGLEEDNPPQEKTVLRRNSLDLLSQMGDQLRQPADFCQVHRMEYLAPTVKHGLHKRSSTCPDLSQRQNWSPLGKPLLHA